MGFLEHTPQGGLRLTEAGKQAARRVSLSHGEPQVIYDGPPGGLESCGDPRVSQFVRGEAGERLREMAVLREGSDADEGDDA